MNNRYYTYRDMPTGYEYVSTSALLLTNATGYIEYESSFDIDRKRSDYYIMYIVEGQFTLELDSSVQTGCAGDVIFYRAGDRQRYHKRNNSLFRYYWLHFTGYAAQHILSTCGFENSGIYHVGLNDRIVQCFNTHFADFYANPTGGTYREISAAAHLMELLASMHGTLDGENLKSANMREKIYASAKYINENYSSPLSVEELAHRQGLCTGYYSKMFIRYFGTSPQNYIIRIRLQNACMLLQQSNMSIMQIACSVGYEDSLYFSRIFKKNLGISPASYRKTSK